jgi:hypothetical protein
MDDRDEFGLISRRLMLGGSMAVGAALATPAFAANSPLERENGIPSDAASRIAITRRVRMRADKGLVFWWFRGRNYAQQGARLIPLCELIFGSMMDITPTADGGLAVVQYELGFRTALDSGERTEKLHNPVTGQMVDVPFAPVGPTHLTYSAQNVLQLPSSFGGSQFTTEHMPDIYYRLGDTLCFQTHSAARVVTPGQRDRVVNDMSMICSPMREALDTRRAYASAYAHGSDVTDYARWLKMPADAGTQTLRSIGQKVARWQDMPADWLAMVARSDPEMARDPLAVLRRPQAVYKN